MNLNQVTSTLNTLQLRGVLETIAKRTEQAVAENLHPSEFLQLILQDEVLHRKNKKAQRLEQNAKFRTQATLEDWDQSFDRGVSKSKLKELASLGFYLNKENLVLLGKTGEGKTQLSIAIGRRICQQGDQVTFMPVNLFFEEVQMEKIAGTYLKYLKKLSRSQLIIFDDFGLRNYTHQEANQLLDLLEERYQKTSFIITSQVDPRGWTKLFEDPIIAEAIVDRLTKPSQTITLKGGSYRDRIGSQKKELN